MGIQLVDVEVVVSFAIDPSKVSLEDAMRWAADAIAAKLDCEAELAKLHGCEELQSHYYNGPCAEYGRVA